MLLHTQKGLDSLHMSSFKLGADVSVATGPVGFGAAAKGVTADIIFFARSKGAYAGLSLDGSVIGTERQIEPRLLWPAGKTCVHYCGPQG
jgi:lipid-binding SYLF domain-containing protein